MKTLPAYLRKPANFKAGSLDDTTQDYQPLLATWLIEMALSMKWYGRFSGLAKRVPEYIAARLRKDRALGAVKH